MRIDQRRWNKTLLPALERLRADLGLPDGCRLKAELHSMLVYARGQFFAPHQDSEKADGMVGTLVVTLPGTLRGGALVVEHGGERATYRSSEKLLSFVAFYADCHHQVRPVMSGYRIVLTYNLLLDGHALAAAAPAPAAVDALAGCLTEHFGGAREEPRRGTSPERLVYLLDHEYTQRALSWANLKGVDAARVAALRTAAGLSECEIVLALAEVHETWSAFEPDWARPRRRGHWDEDEDEVSESDEYELDELIDWSTTLSHWLDDSGASAQPIVTAVGDDEVCATTPTASLAPYDSEYEGYMGNYGNTMDRWYRRGAVVLWPRRRDFAVRAEASPAWALDALTARVEAGELARAQQLAASMAPFWDATVRTEQRQALFCRVLPLAHRLDEPTGAAMLLRPFAVELLTSGDALALAALAARYGEAWLREVMGAWFGRAMAWTSPAARLSWFASLPSLCAALHSAGRAGTMAALLLLDDAWGWLGAEVGRCRLLGRPSRREQALDELAQPIAALLDGAVAISAVELRDRVVESLCAGDDAVLHCLVQVQRVASVSPAHAGYEALARHCVQRLEARLGQPPRSDDDWSIEAPGGCDCALCATLSVFLTDQSRRALEWPLAEQGRRHVHERIDTHELPVRHQTRRAGRPYTLVLTKTDALFEREARVRRQDAIDLDWLRGHVLSR